MQPEGNLSFEANKSAFLQVFSYWFYILKMNS